MSLIKGYVWVVPAFVRSSPVDHTWVTSYDCRVNPILNIENVENANELYWYCEGSFHAQGGTPRHKDGFIVDCDLDGNVAQCFVDSNNTDASGTIKWYGIHGVCHQITNQVLYPFTKINHAVKKQRFHDPLKTNKVRGYKLSSAIYGKFGRRTGAWYEKTVSCYPSRIYGTPPFKELVQRVIGAYNLKSTDVIVTTIETARVRLLSDIDEIGFAQPGINETNEIRANKLNDRINAFLKEASEILPDSSNSYFKIFGVDVEEEMDLIDKNIFKIPG